MHRSANILQLIIEALCLIAAVELSTLLLLPKVVAGMSGTFEAIIHAAALTLIAGPLILWRTFTAVRTSRSGTQPAAKAELGPASQEYLLVVTAVIITGLGLTALAATAAHRNIRLDARTHFDQLTERLLINAKRRVAFRIAGRDLVLGTPSFAQMLKLYD